MGAPLLAPSAAGLDIAGGSWMRPSLALSWRATKTASWPPRFKPVDVGSRLNATPRADDTVRRPRVAWDRREAIALAALLATLFVTFHFRLRSVIISDMDEGTYMYAAQLIERGFVPYRDFMLAHPPLIAFLMAGWRQVLGPSLMAARSIYIALIMVSTIPLYAWVRSESRSRSAALLAVVTYTSGMLLVANMGRTVRLEPLMNAFVIGAFALRFLRPRARASMAAMGALFALGLLVKLVAVVPAGLLLLADVTWDRPLRGVVRRWLVAAAGAALVLLPALSYCLRQPHFVEDVIFGQLNRPRLGLALRLHYFAQNIVRFPPILIGLLAACYYLVKTRDTSLRAASAVSLGSTAILLFGFKTFFNYYIVQALPWIAYCFATALAGWGARFLRLRWNALSLSLVALLGILVPLGYAEAYERGGAYHVAGPQKIVQMLRSGDGYLYTMYPGFALWSGRSLYPWYDQADSLVPRITGAIGDRDFVNVFAGSTALVLFSGELDELPLSKAYTEAHFTREYRDADWSLWLRQTGSTR
jgi:hypothetical protein